MWSSNTKDFPALENVVLNFSVDNSKNRMATAKTPKQVLKIKYMKYLKTWNKNLEMQIIW